LNRRLPNAHYHKIVALCVAFYMATSDEVFRYCNKKQGEERQPQFSAVMHVVVDERRIENDDTSCQWQVRFKTKLMPVDRHRPRWGRGQRGGGVAVHDPEPKLVLSIGGPSLLALLNLIYMYASVDTWTILPVLVLVNVVAVQWTMEELGWT
jgi:hypothetical protein